VACVAIIAIHEDALLPALLLLTISDAPIEYLTPSG
jgi:hypothetical protein